LKKIDMARCLNTISEQFKENKINSTYEYFKNNALKIGRGNRPKKDRIRAKQTS
jgi:hypothetical protein